MNKIKCWLCEGTGYWIDEVDQKTKACEVCTIDPARRHLPGWVTSRWDKLPAKYYGPEFRAEPWLLVIHSASIGTGPAEYFADPEDGREVSTHLAWSREKKRAVQCVSFNHAAWHVGKSGYRGNRLLNFCSIGYELPGPNDAPRSNAQRAQFRRDIIYLMDQVPSLKVAVRHRDIDSRKRDPGDGFRWSWLSDLIEVASW